MEEWSLVAFSCRNVISCRVPSLSVFKASLFFKFGSMLFMPSKTDAVLQCCAAAALRNMICHRLQLTGCLSKPDHLWGLLWHLGDEGEPENMAEAAQRVSCNFGSNYRNWRVLEGLCSFLASWLTTVFLFFCFFFAGAEALSGGWGSITDRSLGDLWPDTKDKLWLTASAQLILGTALYMREAGWVEGGCALPGDEQYCVAVWVLLGGGSWKSYLGGWSLGI